VLNIFVAAFGLGLVFNAAPGPVFAATVRYGVWGGFRPALAVQIGSLAGDAVWAVLGLAGVGFLARLEPVRTPLGVAGAAYLVWLAWDAWRASQREFLVSAAAADRSESALRSGIVLSLTNPQNIGYWAALGSALGALGVHRSDAPGYAVFFGGFMLSSIAWALVFAATVDRVLGRAGARWAQVTYRMCAVVFLALALTSLTELWTSRGRSLESQPRTIPGER